MKLKEEATKVICDEFKITEGTLMALFENNIIDQEGTRNYLIRKDYKEMGSTHAPDEAKNILADRYCLSFSMVEKVVHNRTKV